MTCQVIHQPSPNVPAVLINLKADCFEVLEWIFRRGGIEQGVYDPEFERKELARLKREQQLKGKA